MPTAYTAFLERQIVVNSIFSVASINVGSATRASHDWKTEGAGEIEIRWLGILFVGWHSPQNSLLTTRTLLTDKSVQQRIQRSRRSGVLPKEHHLAAAGRCPMMPSLLSGNLNRVPGCFIIPPFAARRSPASAEASDGRCGAAALDRLELGRRR